MRATDLTQRHIDRHVNRGDLIWASSIVNHCLLEFKPCHTSLPLSLRLPSHLTKRTIDKSVCPFLPVVPVSSDGLELAFYSHRHMSPSLSVCRFVLDLLGGLFSNRGTL